MRTDPPSAKDAPAGKPMKLFLWVAFISLFFGLIRFGDIVENPLRVVRNSIHPSQASGEIVLVGIDDASLTRVGEWPWPRTKVAALIDKASGAGAKIIFVDSLHEAPTNQVDDRAFADAIARSGRVVMPVRDRVGVDRGNEVHGLPYKPFRDNARLATVSLFYNYQHAVWDAPFSQSVNGRSVPSFASAMAGRWDVRGDKFRIDYSINPSTVPQVSAADLLAGNVDRDTLAGKTVIIASVAERIGDDYWIPGHGRMAGAFVHILGAETLKKAVPVNLGFWPAWVFALGVIAAALFQPASRAPLFLGGAAAAVLALPVLTEANLVFLDIVPALFAIAVIGGRLGWVRWRAGGLTNSLTGMPNLHALRTERGATKQALVAARVHNYAQIASTLDAREESTLISQFVQRLSISGPRIKVYQGDEGIFAWFADPAAPLANHLEALHALFRSPLSVNGKPIDLALSFGVELGSGRSLSNRLGSALVAADEAWSEGLRWKYYDPAQQEEVDWRLSLLGQLDAAIDNGEVWVAYQPQLDLHSRKIIGAEALARWTHPEKGPISPSEFIAAAEQQGRIAKLTSFVLERSIATANSINKRGIDFTIAVNISARLLADQELPEMVRRLLKQYGLRPDRLTLELTETEALRSADAALGVLDRLRSTGVKIAIDDYGTGMSTLDYLKKVPASELKIDQSFIKAMRVNRSDLIMVQSTIALARSLDRTVVAEGVEDRELLDQLADMGCNVAQGFAIGRPMGVRELVQRLEISGDRRVA